MSLVSARLSLGFSGIGHTYSHLFQPIFYVAALALEKDLNLTHGSVVMLVVGGNVMMGVAAPFAGWLGDRWSSVGMMALFFAGTGFGMVMTGFAEGPLMIAVWLGVTGFFASIYHPVGMAWVVRNAKSRGKALGVNGLFGGLGPAGGALMAGALIDLVDWRAAFYVPGAAVAVTGAVFLVFVAAGAITDSKVDRKPDPPAPKRDRVRAFLVLSITMLCTGLIYQATQPALPKVFSERLAEMVSGGVFGISVFVAAVYLTAGALQIIGGHLADRYPLKTVYLVGFVLQVPLLFAAASLAGTPLALLAIVMVAVNVGSLPAENMLVARYAPSQWRGVAYGLKFILVFGVSGMGVIMEGVLYDLSGDFYWLFAILAAIAAAAATVCFLLPAEERRPAPLAAE